LVNQDSRSAYFSQLALGIFLSSLITFNRPGVQPGLFAPVAWAVCGLSTWREEGSTLKDLWRHALYRYVILCAGILVVMLAGLFIVPVRSNKVLLENRNKCMSLIRDILRAGGAKFGQEISRSMSYLGSPLTPTSAEAEEPSGNFVNLRLELQRAVSERRRLLDEAKVEGKVLCMKMKSKEENVEEQANAIGAFVAVVSGFKEPESVEAAELGSFLKHACTQFSPKDPEARLLVLEISRAATLARATADAALGASATVLLDYLRLAVED
jgi:hypothetical protein